MLKSEAETIISFTAADTNANVYSCDPVWMKRIKKIKGWTEVGHGVAVDVPKAWVKMPKEPSKRKPTETQLKALAKARQKTRSSSN